MAERRPLVVISGVLQELPSGDTLPGGVTPGGSTTQIQYNDAGAFAGDDDFTWTAASRRLIIGVTGQGEIKSGTGQALKIQGGSGQGQVSLWGGTTASGVGSTVNIAGGGSLAGQGGKVVVYAGNSAGTNQAGGFIELRPSKPTGTGADGYLQISRQSGNGAASPIRLEGDDGFDFVIRAPSAAGVDREFILPTDAPADGEVLTWNTGGQLSWEAAGAVPDPLLLSDGALAAPSHSFTNYTSTGMFAQAGPVLSFAVSGGIAMDMRTTRLDMRKVTTFPAGSAAAPTISTPLDLNTGIYFDESDGLYFSTGGIQRLSISSAGAVVVAGNMTWGASSTITANYATVNNINQLNAARLNVSAGTSYVTWNSTTATADNRMWQSSASSDGSWYFKAVNDAGNLFADVIRVDRTGQTIDEIDLTANKVSLGNFTFNADQTVGAGQDNYVLTYDNATGEIGLEAAAGGGGISNVIEDTTPQLGGDLDVNGHDIVAAPAATATSNGGPVRIVASNGGSTSGAGGTATVLGGDATLSGYGGPAQVRAGNAAGTNQNGGIVELIPGANTGLGNPGYVIIKRQNGTGSVAALRFEDSGGNYTALKSVTTAANRTWTLPNDDPSTVSGQFITTDASGNLSFAAASGLFSEDAQNNIVGGTNAAANNPNNGNFASNFIAGVAALTTATAQHSSIYIGHNAGYYVNTTEYNNVVVGAYAHNQTTGNRTGGSYGTFIGSFAGSNVKGDYCTYLGYEAGKHNTSGCTGNNNTGIGYHALFNTQQTSAGNTAVGALCMDDALYGTSTDNTAIGYAAFPIMAGSSIVGATALGAQAGSKVYNGAGSVFIGYKAGPTSANTYTNELYINNAESNTPLLHGYFDAHASGPLLTVNGDLEITQHVYFDAEVANTTAVAINWTNGNKQSIAPTASGNPTYTFTAPDGPTSLTLKATNLGAAGTVTWPATVKWPGGTEPTWTSSGTDIISFYYDGTNYYGAAGLNYS